jgi:26S proteasome regulatory subunit N1
LEEKRADESKLDSHKVNLSITYANAFINAGFSTDTIMMKEGEDQDWIYKNKDSGQIAATASVGLLLLWNIDEGFDKIDKYMESTNDQI